MCGGVTWKSDWTGEYIYSGRSSFAGMRWVFIGPHMPEAFWEFENEPKKFTRHVKINMLTVVEDDVNMESSWSD
jgi:hypothetical protein